MFGGKAYEGHIYVRHQIRYRSWNLWDQSHPNKVKMTHLRNNKQIGMGLTIKTIYEIVTGDRRFHRPIKKTRLNLAVGEGKFEGHMGNQT